jgi:hypothetical protein
MAKQAGEFKITGIIDDLCFYKMCGVYYVRMKSSLTGKRFRKDKAFEGSRKSCSRFGDGNKLASKVYNMLMEEKRVYKLFCFLKRRAILLLKEGKNLEEAEAVLIDYLAAFGLVNRINETEPAVVEEPDRFLSTEEKLIKSLVFTSVIEEDSG